MRSISRRTLLQSAIAAAPLVLFPKTSLAQDHRDLALEHEAIISDHMLNRGSSDYVSYARVGDYRMATVPTYTYLDADSTIEVLVFLSEDTPNPKLVVFSHGALAEPSLYRYLLNHWVSHGYIVVAPIHDDSITRQGLNIRQSQTSGAAIWDFSGILNDVDLWETRGQMCNLVLDSVPVLNRTFGVEINAERPIISGHSYGAFTAQMLLGAKVKTSNGIMTTKDPRWAGGILMSPQGEGIMGLYEGSWEDVNRPVMVLTGGNDVDASGQDAARKADAFWLSPENQKHFGYMEYAKHTIFTGQSSRPGTYDEKLFADVKSVTIAFLKAYANHDVVAYSHLQDDYFSAQTVEPDDPSTNTPGHSRIYMQTR